MQCYRGENFYYASLCFTCCAKLPCDKEKSVALRETSCLARVCNLYCLELFKRKGKEFEKFFSLEQRFTALRQSVIAAKASSKDVEKFVCEVASECMLAESQMSSIALAYDEFVIELAALGRVEFADAATEAMSTLVTKFMRMGHYEWVDRIYTAMYSAKPHDREDESAIVVDLARMKMLLGQPQKAVDLLRELSIPVSSGKTFRQSLLIKIESLAILGEKNKAMALYKTCRLLINKKTAPVKTHNEKAEHVFFCVFLTRCCRLLDLPHAEFADIIQENIPFVASVNCRCFNCRKAANDWCVEVFLLACKFRLDSLVENVHKTYEADFLNSEQDFNNEFIEFYYVDGLYYEYIGDLFRAVDSLMYSVSLCKAIYLGDYPLYREALVALERCCSKTPPKKSRCMVVKWNRSKREIK